MMDILTFTSTSLVTPLLSRSDLGSALLPLAQAGGVEGGGISNVALWVGLGVLLAIFIVIVIRAFGPHRRIEEEREQALPSADRAEELEEPAEKKPSLKEIKAARAARVATDSQSREALLKARQARKGASRVEIEEAQKEVVSEEGAPSEVSDEAAAAPEAAEAETEVVGAEAAEVRLAGAAPGEEPPPTEAPAPTTEEPAPAETAPPAKEPAPAKAEPPAGEKVPAKPAPKSLEEGLAKTRSGFVSRLKGLFSRKKQLDAELVGELEEVLLTADIGIKTSTRLLETVEAKLDGNGEVSSDQVWELLRAETAKILRNNQRPLRIGEERPFVILVIGVNGVGKTTTIGKLASRFVRDDLGVLLVAGDTFRAAATEQLEIWGERTGCEVFSGPEGRDPSAVVYDGIKRAIEAEIDVVLVDTAGRLHTKVNLVEELKKVRRVSAKALDGAPHEVLLVLDANTGQNAINQAEMFGKEVGVTGIALTKLDGTAKGGVVIGICDELGVPIQFIGIGEQVEDLREFDADEFVEAVF